MAVCPKCKTLVEQDFGVSACSGCGSVLVVDMDGNVTVSQPEVEEESSAGAQDSTVEEAPPSEINFDEPIQNYTEAPEVENPLNSGFGQSEELPGNSFQSFEAPPEVDGQVEQGFEQPQVAEAVESLEAVEEVPVETVEAEVEAVDAEVEAEAEAAPAVNPDYLSFDQEREPAADAANSGNAISDINDFANSADEEGNSFQYVLVITEINNVDVKNKIMEILTDIRLGINVKEIENTVHRGRLELPPLNAARTSVIVAKLSEFPIHLSWGQSVWKN